MPIEIAPLCSSDVTDETSRLDKLLGPPFGQCASDHMGSDLPVDRAGRSVLLADLFPLFSEKARGQIVTVQLLRSTE